MKALKNVLKWYYKKFNSFSFYIYHHIRNINVIIIAICFALYSCVGKENKTEQKTKKIPLVTIQQVSKSQLISSVDITATVQANIMTIVKSPADGIIEKLFARENQYVEKDKLVAIINPNDRVSLISSNIEKIERLTLELQSTDKNSDSYYVLLAEIENAKSDLEYAKNMLNTIPVVCPLSGLVTQRWLDEGSQVSAKENILTITDMNSLVLKAEVNERYFEAIKKGKTLPVILNAYPNDTLRGIISLVYPQIDPVSRSVKFDIKLQNASKLLLPGMMAIVKIPLAVIDNALTIPEYSILTTPDNKNFVYTIDPDSIVYKRIIKTGINIGNKTQVVFGLNENDRIVISGQDMLKDSLKVKVLGSSKENKK